MVSAGAVLFVTFAFQAVLSGALALLGLRAFVLRERGDFAGNLRRARLLLRLAGAVPFAYVVLVTVASGGGPFVSVGGWLFLLYGVLSGVLGLVGAALFARAAADPRRAWVKAAETVPFCLLLLSAGWANNWAPLFFS